MANQAIETPKAIILTDEWGDKLIMVMVNSLFLIIFR